MATGASTADLAILLVDARHGVREQTRRHARIAQLLGITNLVLAVNKMDLVDFDRAVFDEICREFAAIQGDARVHAIPMSALNGDNVITTSDRTPWFDGPSLLEYLETVEVDRDATSPAVPVSGAAGRPPVGRLSRLRRSDFLRRRRRRRYRHRVAGKPLEPGQADRDLGRRHRTGVRADVGDIDARRLV